MNTLKFSMLFLAMASLALTSCKKEGCTDSTAINYDADAKKDDGSCNYASSTLVIDMSHQVDGVDAIMNSLDYMSPFGNEYSITKCRYFISDVVLHSASGNVEVDEAHYVDMTMPNTLTWNTGLEVPAGDYTSVSFIFGLDEEKNVDGYFNTNPEAVLEWPSTLGGGYHYMQMEGQYDSLDTGADLKNYLTHLGPTNGNQYYFEADLSSSSFTVPSDENTTVNVEIIMNINNWYQNPNLYDFNDYMGIMMNEGVQAQFQENGNDVFSAGNVSVD